MPFFLLGLSPPICRVHSSTLLLSPLPAPPLLSPPALLLLLLSPTITTTTSGVIAAMRLIKAWTSWAGAELQRREMATK